MPVTPAVSYPGVYVQEVPSGVRTIAGVGTSIGLFIGASTRGPIGSPRRCVSYSAFREIYGDDPAAGDLAHYVRLFFLNGGTDCWVMRIANGAMASSITLMNEAGTLNALTLTAKDRGADGEYIRALVSYGGAQPEVTFNIDLYTYEIQSGVKTKVRRESFKNLTMDPLSPAYAPTFLTQNSKLVDATLPGGLPPLVAQGLSRSGRPVVHLNTNGDFVAAWEDLIGNEPNTRNQFRISINGSAFVNVDLSDIDVSAEGDPVALANEIRDHITTAFANDGMPGIVPAVNFVNGPPVPVGPPGVTTLLQITYDGDVFIRPGLSNDLAVPLMLGSEQGGLEIGRWAGRRPAPTGITIGGTVASWETLAALPQNSFVAPGTGFTLDQTLAAPAVGTTPRVIPFPNLVLTVPPADPFYREANIGSPNGNNDGIRERLNRMAAAINTAAQNDPLFRWSAQVAGTRLTITPLDNVDDNFRSAVFATLPVIAGFLNNVHAYSVGIGGLAIGGRQTLPVQGTNGLAPLATDYDNAYLTIDSEVDLFNLMVLAPVAGSLITLQQLYGNASVFCQQRRAFLLMDSPDSWADPQTATAGLTTLRTGLVKDYSAVFYPDVTIDQNGLKRNIGPSGALAGLFARIDSTRGVWKAPAGTEADLRGIVGLESRLSDRENGILNPRAINTLRVFPSGIVNWGARTNQGDDDTPHDYKYIPIRRLALFIEESLYRGLKWVVFEPNDEPMWAQVRLNVGAFMHNLFRQGAFQGRTPRDAYFVKCDAETTTQNDRNLGIVNVWVGFAPLKPAEFVILYLQQMAGQIET